MSSDAELLRRYAADKAEAAFAELVRRHINLVYSVALRQMAGDAHLAEDVAQQVFTALARKAAQVSRRVSLSGWLYRSTHYAASDLVRSERRRRARETEAHMMNEIDAGMAAADWEKARPILDAAIAELDERDRDAVALRFFDGCSFAEMGTRLRVTENTARMRVERAVDKLHGLLAKRGITSTAGALAAVLARQAVTAAPTGLAASVTGAALSAVADAGVLAFMTATKTTIVLAVAAALATATALYQMQHAHAAAASLDAGRRDLSALRGERARLSAQAKAEEDAMAATTAATRAAVVEAASAQAAALEKQRADRALQQFLDTDPQLQQLARQWEKVGLAAQRVDERTKLLTA